MTPFELNKNTEVSNEGKSLQCGHQMSRVIYAIIIAVAGKWEFRFFKPQILRLTYFVNGMATDPYNDQSTKLSLSGVCPTNAAQ